MKTIILAVLVALVAGRPDAPRYSSSSASASGDQIDIIRDDRVYPSDQGQYSLDFETANGIAISESGVGSGPDGAVESQGTVSFTLPDGTPYKLTYVASADGGFQPESNLLPVAPEFPHPIPDFVKAQIAKAAEEDAAAARGQSAGRAEYN